MLSVICGQQKSRRNLCYYSIAVLASSLHSTELSAGTKPGSACGVGDSLKQGCLSEAYRDVFTACPTHHPAISALSVLRFRAALSKAFLIVAPSGVWRIDAYPECCRFRP